MSMGGQLYSSISFTRMHKEWLQICEAVTDFSKFGKPSKFDEGQRRETVGKAKDLSGFLKTCTNTKSEIKRAGGDIMQFCLRLNRLNPVLNLDRSMVPRASPSVNSDVQVQPLTKDMQVQTELQADDVGYTTVYSATQTLEEEERESLYSGRVKQA
nr:unnamed protein product [Callosobruchus analis]